MVAAVKTLGGNAPGRDELLEALVALGPILALERIGDEACCCRWFAQAAVSRSIVARVALAPDGPREELLALDRIGATRARLVRMPESDYFAWERALEHFRAVPARAPGWPPHAAHVARGVLPRWRGRLVRLHREPMSALAAIAIERLSSTTAGALCTLARSCEIAFLPNA